jgi:DNA gyrase inhibitor GyrI
LITRSATQLFSARLHYCDRTGQPEQLKQCIDALIDWSVRKGLVMQQL